MSSFGSGGDEPDSADKPKFGQPGRVTAPSPSPSETDRSETDPSETVEPDAERSDPERSDPERSAESASRPTEGSERSPSEERQRDRGQPAERTEPPASEPAERQQPSESHREDGTDGKPAVPSASGLPSDLPGRSEVRDSESESGESVADSAATGNTFARRESPRVIAIANQKGGVGKTTTTVNFGAAAAELGHRVLIIDLDPQGNASTGLGINPRSLEASMYDVLLHDVPLDEAIEAAEVRNLFVAPANLDLAGAEIELVPAFSRELRLKNAIATVADDFDMVLIDCPPSLGLLTVNAFAAATEVMVPIQCEYYALEGLGQLLRNVDLVKRNLNASLELSAIVLVMYDARTNLAAQVAGEVREHFGSKVCRAVIPRNIRLSEAPSFGQPITVFDPSSRGAIAYRDLAKEVAGEST